MLARARLLIVGAALAAAPAMAAGPFAVELGGARVLLDAPAGFSDTTFTGSPRIQELAESLTSASNHILLFAISDGDLRSFMNGDTPDFRRYMLATTPKVLERALVSSGDFAQLSADLLREAGPAAPGGNFMKHLDQPPYGQPRLLAELRREREVVSILQGMRLPPADPDHPDQKPEYVLFSTTLLWLRGKALALSIYTRLDAPGDMEWLRYTTARWTSDLQRLNSR